MKIKYFLRNKHTNQLHVKIYELESIERGGLKDLFDVDNYEIVARLRFTGLHDKNGVEIYEGDVVKWCYSKHYWEAVISTIPNNKTNTLYAVETYHNCTTDETEEINTFERSDSRKGVRNELEYLSKDIEIIGNVYQNQELIK